MYIYARACACARRFVCIYLDMYIHACIPICVYICICMCVYILDIDVPMSVFSCLCVRGLLPPILANLRFVVVIVSAISISAHLHIFIRHVKLNTKPD